MTEKKPGLPESLIKIIKPTYLDLCDQTLLSKCLHGMTQNCNESFNNIIWTIIPKETFVGLQTLLLGTHIAVILFNSGYNGLLHVFEHLGMTVAKDTVAKYLCMDKTRIKNSIRQSLPNTKLARKKKRAIKKSKLMTYNQKEGLTYKCGEF